MKNKTRALCLIVALFIFFFAQVAQAVPATPTFHRGINLAAWLANAPRQPLYERDFYHLSEVGFDHIRLPFNPEQFGFALRQSSSEAVNINLADLDRAVTMALKHKLAIIIDLHPLSRFMQTLEDNDWAEEQVIKLWINIARYFSKVSPGKLAFGLLNEPQYYHKGARYQAFIKRLADAVRAAAPEHMLIVSAPEGSSLEGLQKFTPLADANIMYDFHFYEPYMVTHQGIHMGFEKKMLRYFRRLPYPSNLVDKKADYYAPIAPNLAQAQDELQEYVDAKWNFDRIVSRIKLAADWAEQYKVRVICGEFGVLRNHIDKTSRYRWISDTRRALERFGIGWELWDYSDLAGIAVPVGETSTDPVDGSVRLIHPAKSYRRIEREALPALGLKQ
ncbi:MAG: cellulase family glycosylhydrolase [Alphaproteobacteria bacterium]